MRVSLKLNDIEQEHLQELYDAAGVARDELPYTEQFDRLCEDFQFRTFKNAEKEQVYGALLKYTRSSTCPSGKLAAALEEPDKVKLIREVLRRQGNGGKVLPYSSEFDAAMKEFNSLAGMTLAERDFWLAISQAQGKSRRPPTPRKRPMPQRPEEEEAGNLED